MIIVFMEKFEFKKNEKLFINFLVHITKDLTLATVLFC